MKLRRILALLLVLAITLSASLMLTACGGEDDDGSTNDSGNNNQNNNNQGGNNQGAGNQGGNNQGGNNQGGNDQGGNDQGGSDQGGNDQGGSDNGGDTSAYFTEDGELILFNDGVPTFKFVVGSDASGVKSTIDEIAATLTGLSAEGCTVRSENYQSEVEPVEILIGTVNSRGDEYKYNKYELGMNGYIVKQVGTKIVVNGGSEAALANAVIYLKEKVFGIKKANDPMDFFFMEADLNKVEKQTGYNVSDITVNGVSLKNYVISYTKANTAAKNAATALNQTLYEECGIYVPVDNTPDDGVLTFSINSIANTGAGNGYELFVDEDGNIVLNCEFDYLIASLVSSFTESMLANKGTVAYNTGMIDTKDVRNIYYDDNGAVGNGVVNDFAAIKKTHDLANQYGHIVNANAGSTYLIKDTEGETIPIMTDTNWNGCTFIFDDSFINVHSSSGASHCNDCANRFNPIFYVTKTQSAVDVAKKFAYVTPDTPLNGGYGEADNTTKIEGWDLPYLALVKITSKSHKIYVRGGNKDSQANADDGDHQCEFILVHPDGTIDPSTPLSWDYTDVAWASAENVDPEYVKPITIDGGGALINTISNAPGEDVQNAYYSFSRNIYVQRANTTLKNFHHRLLNEGTYRAPYAGILTVNHTNNVTFRDITLQAARRRWQNGVQQGTYEIGGMGGNDIKYYNVDSINFFSDGTDWKNAAMHANSPGNLHMGGTMGTNYCRNFLFEDCTLNSFDSHKGLGNVTLRRCEIGSASMQGSGDILIEDHTAFMSAYSRDVVGLRADYGSTWRGTLTMRNVTIKYDENFDYTQNNKTNFIVIFETNEYEENSIFETFFNPETGKYEFPATFTNYMPSTILLDNISVKSYNYASFDKDTRTFTGWVEKYADDTVYLFNRTIYGRSDDIRTANANKYIPADSITVLNSQAYIILPDTKQFSDCKFTIENSENTSKGT